MCAGANNPMPSFSNTVGPSGADPPLVGRGHGRGPDSDRVEGVGGLKHLPTVARRDESQGPGMLKDQRSRVSLRAV